MKPISPGEPVARPRRGVREVLKSYFYWTYARGSFQYDVMVTLILLFIFITPHLWNYGDKPSRLAGPMHPIEVSSDGGHGLIVIVPVVDVKVPADASNRVVKNILRQAIEPVTGDSVFVERWKTVTDDQGDLAWKIWAHR
jgi:hypothetical protein